VGLHNLQFMVTDRPFFKPPRRDADGEILRDERGKISYGPEQCGVPDLAGGATYAVTNYVFECGDASEGSDDDCDCAEVEPQ
jgi:hypothetical protein